MKRIVRSTAARRDINQIWSFIAKESPRDADRLIERIDMKLYDLRENPYLGGSRSELRPGLRSISLGNYILFYGVTNDSIRLIRVLHSARDLSKIFPEG